jgi:hypothetical protein
VDAVAIRSPERETAPVLDESDDPLLGAVPGGAELDATGSAVAPARKRKRRRRRGARDRGDAASSGEQDGSSGDDDGGDESTSESRSPYAAVDDAPPRDGVPAARGAVTTTPAPRPFTPPLPAPTPIASAPSARGDGPLPEPSE